MGGSEFVEYKWTRCKLSSLCVLHSFLLLWRGGCLIDLQGVGTCVGTALILDG